MREDLRFGDLEPDRQAYPTGLEGVPVARAVRPVRAGWRFHVAGEIARRTAEVHSDCGFDMVYLDAIDGAAALGGRRFPAWYRGRFIAELNQHLRRPALMELSAFDSHFWGVRSRLEAGDVPSKSYPLFINAHFAENRVHARSFLPRNLGWWAVWDRTPRDRMRMFPEDLEHLLCKSLDSPTLGGRTLVFPVELESGQDLELRSGPDFTVYGPTGEVVSSGRPRGERPILRAGDNELRFDCGLETPVNPRVRVTVLSRSPDSFGG